MAQPERDCEMTNLKYVTIADDWEVLEGDVFISPLIEKRPNQIIIFADNIRNGSISADITLLESNSESPMEAHLVFRYSEDGHFYAGTGGWSSKFFIGKYYDYFYRYCRGIGLREWLLPNKRYKLRIEFSGGKITFYENDVMQFVYFDENDKVGQVGLKTWKTKARFENIRIEKERPKAFVIMPFVSELDFVHKVIENTIQSFGIDCIRADQIAVSHPVMDDVKTQIAEADLIIVDFTGKNPNVYYEAGLADAWRKNWIVLTQSSDDLTFDVRHIRSIRYSNTMGGDKKFESDLIKAIEALGYKR
jgi:hypothetical protein